MKLEFDKKKKEWKELPKGSREGFYIDGYLKAKLDNVKKLMNNEWDVVFLIDGIEGSGKSTLSFACAYYVGDTDFTMKNVAEGTTDAVEKLKNLPDKSVLVIDEGSLSFSSKDVMSKEQRQLEKILNVIRQKRMCLIIVAPSFFDLSKTISVRRSRFLLHVYTGKDLQRGRFSYFGERPKAKLYDIGKKHHGSYSYPKANFVASFRAFDPLGEEYQKLKRRSLMEAIEGKKETKRISRYEAADIKFMAAMEILTRNKDKKIADVCKDLGLNKSTFYIKRGELQGKPYDMAFQSPK